ncbi:MAG: hypothetical protein A4S09_07085 [Proteobacteria bacterium SG_bin7]|nr:MAG: hypothetical protein A4S09_07085 [Proteobacteria bacterium SG_bin7]
MKKVKSILIASLVVVGIGCNTKKELVPVSIPESVPSPSKPSSVPTPKTSSAGVKFQISEPNVPNQYQIWITWPKDFKTIVIEDSGVSIFQSTPGQREFFYTLRDNSPYSLRAFLISDDGIRVVGEYKGRTPKDLVFSGSLVMEKELNFDVHRVFFAGAAKIQTNGFNFKIKADKIFSENAEIFTFPRNQKATLAGRHGGNVNLVGSEATGNLRISMRGESGGDGIDGMNYSTRAADGASGSAGAHDCARALGAIVRCWCTSSPGPGMPGADGLDGRPGSDSGKGGNSGSVVVKITTDHNFHLNVEQEAGISGNPGHGSEGQEGGHGGAPGNPTSNECGGSYPGQNGKRGKSGTDGMRPSDGEIEKKCISIGQVVRDCE